MTQEFGEQPPTTVVAGFSQKAGLLQVTLGYATFPHGVLLLFAQERVADREPVLWRRFWVSRTNAVAEARKLCNDAARYLDMVSTKWRPSEDLDFDDFIEHLRLHVEGGMH